MITLVISQIKGYINPLFTKLFQTCYFFYPIEKFLKVVASFSRFPSYLPPPKKKIKKNVENSIFLFCALKKSSERWSETHIMLKIAQLTMEIYFWKFILSFETWWYFLDFSSLIQTKRKEEHKNLAKMNLNLFL